jgi:hypothetical protein
VHFANLKPLALEFLCVMGGGGLEKQISEACKQCCQVLCHGPTGNAAQQTDFGTFAKFQEGKTKIIIIIIDDDNKATKTLELTAEAALLAYAGAGQRGVQLERGSGAEGHCKRGNGVRSRKMVVRPHGFTAGSRTGRA